MLGYFKEFITSSYVNVKSEVFKMADNLQCRFKNTKPRETPSVLIIGAGFSGICAAIKLKKELSLDSYEIYELNKDVGGAWFSNTYPGCACDVPIFAYSYSFERKLDWNYQYAPQAEILQYVKDVAQKYEIYDRIKFQHQVNELRWNTELCKWVAEIHDFTLGQDVERAFDIVIHGTGFLRNPKIPKEFMAFQGPILHTAVWNESINLEGKTVAIVGAGSSAIQATPQIAKKAEKLVVYLRNPSWIFPKLDCKFGPATKWIFKNVPFVETTYTWSIAQILEGFWYGMKKDSWLSKKLTSLSNKYRKMQLKDRPDLFEQLSPKQPFGYRRTCISSSYYKTFLKPTTTLITNKIVEVTKDSIITDEGTATKIDILVLATGFRITDYFSPLQVFDRNGNNVLDEWKTKGPSLFLGITCQELPNQFILYGPNTSTGHNSVVLTVEYQMDWIIKCLREMMRRDAKTVAISKSAEVTYMKKIHADMERTVWSRGSRSGSVKGSDTWYADERGEIVAIYPGNLQSFRKIVDKFDVKELEFDEL